MIEMRQVRGRDEIAEVAELARRIWGEHYPPIIGRAQTDYMLDKFQSEAAVARQIAEGYEYYTALEDGGAAGYFALVPNPDEGAALLSKVYVLAARRRAGLGRAMIDFAEARCRELGITRLRLTVNRHNDGSIAFYRRMGFTRTGALVQDIGDGYVMDDFTMEKAPNPVDTPVSRGCAGGSGGGRRGETP
jgi:GNAT superfamily N-acetyltransferase